MEEQKKEVDVGKLYTQTKQRISYLSSKQRVSEHEVYHVMQTFFKDLLKIEYEFSHEELIEELKKTYIDEAVRSKITELLHQIGQIEYSEKTYSQSELYKMLQDFSEILKQVVHETKESKSFWSSILKVSNAKKASTFQVDIQPTEQNNLNNMIDLIKREQDIEKAKEIYKNAYQLYEVTPVSEQEKIYPLLMEAYEHIKLL